MAYLLAMRETRSIQSDGGEYASQQLQCSKKRRPRWSSGQCYQASVMSQQSCIEARLEKNQVYDYSVTACKGWTEGIS